MMRNPNPFYWGNLHVIMKVNFAFLPWNKHIVPVIFKRLAK
jgi:hypothetical protein